MTNTSKIYQGTCHCGKVSFELKTDLKPAVRCNCSICKRKGVPMVTAEEGSFRVTGGEEYLTLYQFNTQRARHFFCKVCGIYTFHNPRSNPALTRVNSGCLDGVDPLALETDLINGAALD
ncbi:GFA family protein [Geopsychrobacter electrodiphilus]|uniref:GFA family protein n=1 Tax=Geopsychrobacter electrodiphilus TaxID=225196 RepID=UPI0003782EF0|nr:GFA family protein [Geopsychrobacter electrodiphilus]